MPKVLVIDDEAAVTSSLHRVLRSILPAHWHVLPETDAQTGLALLSFDRDVQICMVDILMPGMSGVDVIEQALKIRPAMRGRIIVTTGFALTEAEQQHLLVELGCEYLEKPYAIDDLEELIWRLIEEKIAE